MTDLVLCHAVRHHSQPRRAKRRAEITIHRQGDRKACHRRDIGQPPGVLGPAPGGQKRGRRTAGPVQHIGGIGDGKGNALKHRAGQIDAAVMTRQPEKSTPCRGVIMRCPLARQIGMKHQIGGLERMRRKVRHQRFDIGAGHFAQPGHAVACRQNHPHLVPCILHSMAKGMRPAFRRRGKAVSHREHHARGTKREKRIAWRRHAKPHRRRRIVTAAAGNHRGAVNAPFTGQIGAKTAGRSASLDKVRHLASCQAASLKQCVGPAARRHIHPQGARGIRHVGYTLATHPKPEIVLWQKNGGNPREPVGFMLCHPDSLRGGESRHHCIAADAAKQRHGHVHMLRLRGGARVVPQNTGADHLIRGIKRRQPMHLARQANGAHSRHLRGGIPRQRRHRRISRLPPGLRVLFRPSGLWTADVKRRRPAADHHACLIQQKRLHGRGAKVKPEIHESPSFPGQWSKAGF